MNNLHPSSTGRNTFGDRTSGDNGKFLTSAQVKVRFGNISDMTLWRWENDGVLNFPKPIVIQRRKYFREADILAWEGKREKQPSTVTDFAGAV